jgi:capsular exopolysaccharide synthesis family protein
LTQLLNRREELQLELAQRQLPWELISPTTVGSQRVNLSNSIVLGLILGLLLGTGIAIALDAKGDVIYSTKELKRITPVPLLGILPHNAAVEKGYDEQHLLTLFKPSPEHLVSATSRKSKGRQGKNGAAPPKEIFAYREAFRSLFANLRRLETGQPLKSLVISSADDELADSTVAAYLAWAAAEMGNRVLLIDADLRLPHLHDFLELDNEQGFGNILGGESEMKAAVKRSTTEPNLFVMTTGTTDYDPVSLLATQKLQQFVEKTESYFDLVIYDAPPFSQYADAALLSAEATGLVLVSHLGTVKSNQLEQTLEKLWVSKIPLIGIVAKEGSSKLALLPV